VRLLMDLTYRTLQRPESDILGWTPAIITRDEHTKARILHFQQGKTKVWVKIALTADLDALIRRAMGDPPRIDQPLVHNRKGERYTYTGIMAMLTAAIKKANRGPRRRKIPSFGFRDLKGKGATDMWKSACRSSASSCCAATPTRRRPRSTSRRAGVDRSRGAERLAA
jgi:hypothetical protein